MEKTYLSDSISLMVDRIDVSRELPKYFQGQSFDLLLKRLKISLLTTNGLFAEAERRGVSPRDVKLRLPEFLDAFFRAEDIFEEISTEALRRTVEEKDGSFTGQIRGMISGHRSSYKEMESRMEDVVNQLEQLVRSLQQKMPELPKLEGADVSGQQISPSSAPQCGLIGRENDKEAVVRLLLSDYATGDVKHCFIPIVGMPGIGKTALAKAVYNDERVGEYFELKAWVCVGKEFDVLRVTKSVLEQITSSEVSPEVLPMLQEQLKEKLSDKKFLLVIDDFLIESKPDLESFQRALTSGHERIAIVVTTQSEFIPRITMTVQSYPLRLMTSEDCWELISRVVFGDISAGFIDPELERIGKDIANQCKGLPLSALTVASHLQSRPNPREWSFVSTDFSRYTRDILPVLRRSYDSLPSQLKRCFAFCSVFPKGYVFDRHKLVLLWMAIDLLYQPGSEKRMEDIGYEYLDELVSRSFFQPLDSNMTSLTMHDLMNDLSKSVSGDFCFRQEDDRTLKTPDKARHFSFSRSQCDASLAFSSICRAKLLRTILPFDLPPYLESLPLKKEVLNELFQALKHLRILCLSGYHLTSLPESFKGLKHLRYLDLSSTEMKRLPECFCTLYNLQTLLLSNCRSFTKLPTNLSKLINLRYLDLEGTPLTEMPVGISKLRSLQKLSNFVMGRMNTGAGLHELKQLTDLRGSLCITELQNVAFANEAKDAGLELKPSLRDLVLKWNAELYPYAPGRVGALACNQTEVLAMLKPNPNLNTLVIESYQGAFFPSWLTDPSFSNMVSIYLSGCGFCLSLPPLGQLPSLKQLVIEKFDRLQKVGHEFFYKEYDLSLVPFQSLETLSFYNMPRWEEWSSPDIAGGIFPHLKRLVIDSCPRLRREVPKGISPSIVHISKCPISQPTDDETLTSQPGDFKEFLIAQLSFLRQQRAALFQQEQIIEARLRELEPTNSESPKEG